MNITHHPSDSILVAFASRLLDEVPSLLVAAHLTCCEKCCRAVRSFENVGGALLEALDPEPMRFDALQRVMERIDQSEGDVGGSHIKQTLQAPSTIDVPALLAPYELGPWRWVGRGLYLRLISIPEPQGNIVFLLKAAPGTRLPHHRHAGTEWTCVLEGSFTYDLKRYHRGDFDEADETVLHSPAVVGDAPCVCLIALQGRLELEGWLGRLMQPFVGAWLTR
jgi:putative transcriptional regulator